MGLTWFLETFIYKRSPRNHLHVKGTWLGTDIKEILRVLFLRDWLYYAQNRDITLGSVHY